MGVIVLGNENDPNITDQSIELTGNIKRSFVYRGEIVENVETYLGLPAANGYILSSDTSGGRSWVDPTVIGNAYTFTNGLVNSSNNISVGGTLVDDLDLNLDTYRTVFYYDSILNGWGIKIESDVLHIGDLGNNTFSGIEINKNGDISISGLTGGSTILLGLDASNNIIEVDYDTFIIQPTDSPLFKWDSVNNYYKPYDLADRGPERFYSGNIAPTSGTPGVILNYQGVFHGFNVNSTGSMGAFGGLYTDTIQEITGGVGVTIAGVVIKDAGIKLGTGATVNTIETTVTNDDTHIPTSGAIVDYLLSYTGFDSRYYTETELSTSGSASVHWENLTNIDVDIADIDATGTPSSSTYLRGDGTWETPSGGVTILSGPQLYWDAGNNYYRAYNEVDKAAGRFYLGTTTPTDNSRLNYDGNLYASKFYAVGAGFTAGSMTFYYQGLNYNGDSSFDLYSSYAILDVPLEVDIIREDTLNSGVTVDGVLLKDGGITLGTGATVDNIETTVTNDDTHIPTSGAIVDYIPTISGSLTPTSVPVVGGTPDTVTLNCESLPQKIFYTYSISTNVTLSLSNATNIRIISYHVWVTGTRTITFGGGLNWVSDDPDWDDTGNTFEFVGSTNSMFEISIIRITNGTTDYYKLLFSNEQL